MKRAGPGRAHRISHLLLVVLVILTLFPYLFMAVTSLKDSHQLSHSFWLPQLPFHLENYPNAWAQIGNYIYNTVLVTVLAVAGVLAVSSMSAFVLGRFRFPGKNILYFMIIGLMMIPGILTLVPSFMLVKTLHLLNTRAVLVLPAISGGQILGIFILTTFMRGIPEELFEAARMDGAKTHQSFYHIALPMSRDIMVTIAIIITINSWNSYLWPLITVTDNRLKVIAIGLQRFSGTFFLSPQYGPMFAGYVLATVPLFLLFVVSGRYYIKGITSGALKV